MKPQLKFALAVFPFLARPDRPRGNAPQHRRPRLCSRWHRLRHRYQRSWRRHRRRHRQIRRLHRDGHFQYHRPLPSLDQPGRLQPIYHRVLGPSHRYRQRRCPRRQPHVGRRPIRLVLLQRAAATGWNFRMYNGVGSALDVTSPAAPPPSIPTATSSRPGTGHPPCCTSMVTSRQHQRPRRHRCVRPQFDGARTPHHRHVDARRQS